MVVVNGDIGDPAFYQPLLETVDYVMIADGGSRHVAPLCIEPDVIMGDFDSIDSLDDFTNQWPRVTVETFPVHKDYTDSELVVERAMALGPDRITIVGGLGSRWDHSMATLFLLKRIHDQGIEGCVINPHNSIRYVTEKQVFYDNVGQTVSLLPVTPQVTGINLYGFRYPLVDASLKFGETRGISNVVEEKQATVTLEEGVVLVIVARD